MQCRRDWKAHASKTALTSHAKRYLHAALHNNLTAVSKYLQFYLSDATEIRYRRSEPWQRDEPKLARQPYKLAGRPRQVQVLRQRA